MEELNKKFPEVENATKSCKHKSISKQQVSPRKRPLTSKQNQTAHRHKGYFYNVMSSVQIHFAVSLREEERSEAAACCPGSPGAPGPSEPPTDPSGQSVAETVAPVCGEATPPGATPAETQRGDNRFCCGPEDFRILRDLLAEIKDSVYKSLD